MLLVGNSISADEQHVGASLARPIWLAWCPEVRLGHTLPGPAERTFTIIILYFKLSDGNFLPHPASQLYCSAGDALGPSGGASGAAGHRSVPFWDVFS